MARESLGSEVEIWQKGGSEENSLTTQHNRAKLRQEKWI